MHWGSDNWKDSYTAIISSDQHYKLQHYAGQNLVEYVTKTLDKNIVNPARQFNTIRIQKEGEFVYVSINSTQIAKIPSRDFNENKIGFYITKPMILEIDYLHIYQYGDAKINLVKNSINGYQKENLGKNVNDSYAKYALNASSHLRQLSISRPLFGRLFFEWNSIQLKKYFLDRNKINFISIEISTFN